jgi:hypothetical protein
MPHHDELIDITGMTNARTALTCARLQLRGGKRRLQKGLTAAGIAALYDSVLFGMHYYIARHKGCATFVKNTEVWDAASLFHALAQAGVFDDPLVFNRLSLMVERALWQESISMDVNAALAEVEEMLMKLGVISFKKHALPGKSRITH